MKGFLLAIQFLTRIPVTIKGDVSEKELARSAIYFPLAGAVQGLPAACGAFLFSLVFTPEIASGLVILILLLTNGAFHYDGLADMADAISVKSTGDPSQDRKKRLTVMKDSATGAIGVVAIVTAILLKYLFVSGHLKNGNTGNLLSFIFLMPVFSKWVMVPLIYHGRAARRDGLGKTFIEHKELSILLLSSLVLAGIYFLTMGLLSGRQWLDLVRLFSIFSITLYALSLFWNRFCMRKFGGLTGDTLGAASEVSEILFLAVAFLWY